MFRAWHVGHYHFFLLLSAVMERFTLWESPLIQSGNQNYIVTIVNSCLDKIFLATANGFANYILVLSENLL